MLKWKKKVLPRLEKFDAEKMQRWCGLQYRSLLDKVTDVPLNKICRPASEINQDRLEFMKAIRANTNNDCGE